MKCFTPSLVLAASLAVPGCLRSQALVADSGSFALVTAFGDTIAYERFFRSGDSVRGELALRANGLRFTFGGRVTPDGRVSRFDNAYRRIDAHPASPPLQRATLTFAGDTAVVVIDGNTAAPQRIPSNPDAIPYINPSPTLIEQIAMRARAVGGERADIPVFALAGGVTSIASVTRVGSDSVVMQLGPVEIRLAVDASGRVLGGAIPSQQLLITRSSLAAAYVPPDYSAPPDAPYAAENVIVPVPAGHRLAGTLTVPSPRRARVPAVLLLTGSGLQDRDESVMPGYRFFRQIADTLARRGIAVLRLDDRGYGSSTGDPTTATGADFAADARAAVAFLRTRAEIDPRRIALAGHSEGGMTAPMVAAGDTLVRALVLMAAPGWPLRRILEVQNEYAVARADVSAATRDSLRLAIPAGLDSLFASAPYWRFAASHDPRVAARKVFVPVLILHGATDTQVTPEQADELAAAIREGGNADVTVRIFGGHNHLFLIDQSGDPSGYARLPSRLVGAQVLGPIVDWLVAKLGY